MRSSKQQDARAALATVETTLRLLIERFSEGEADTLKEQAATLAEEAHRLQGQGCQEEQRQLVLEIQEFFGYHIQLMKAEGDTGEVD